MDKFARELLKLFGVDPELENIRDFTFEYSWQEPTMAHLTVTHVLVEETEIPGELKELVRYFRVEDISENAITTEVEDEDFDLPN